MSTKYAIGDYFVIENIGGGPVVDVCFSLQPMLYNMRITNFVDQGHVYDSMAGWILESELYKLINNTTSTLFGVMFSLACAIQTLSRVCKFPIYNHKRENVE